VLKAGVSGSATTYIFGDNTWGQIGNAALGASSATPYVVGGNATWKSIALGGAHALAVKSDGTLWAWGYNFNGQLGDGYNGSVQNHLYQSTPEKIGTVTWSAVVAGESHSMALDSAASPALYAWGQNAYGQLGLGTTADSLAPGTASKIAAPSGTKWLSIAAGARHSMALRSDGKILTWGDDTFGQLGNWSVPSPPILSTPTAVIGIPKPPVAIASGSYHSLAILNDGTLWSWGKNTNGQLGYSTASQVDPTYSAFPTQVGVNNDWSAVSGGGTHTLALRGQTLWAWGGNAHGQLGNNTTTDSPSPVQIGTSNQWIAVAAGKYHSMAIDTNNKLWTWGRNAEGQLGNGTTVGPVLVPTMIP
jgi:alpha-tubulin suppressor-like RCC1 family protein